MMKRLYGILKSLFMESVAYVRVYVQWGTSELLFLLISLLLVGLAPYTAFRIAYYVLKLDRDIAESVVLTTLIFGFNLAFRRNFLGIVIARFPLDVPKACVLFLLTILGPWVPVHLLFRFMSNYSLGDAVIDIVCIAAYFSFFLVGVSMLTPAGPPEEKQVLRGTKRNSFEEAKARADAERNRP